MVYKNLARALIGVLLTKAAVVGAWYLCQQANKEVDPDLEKDEGNDLEKKTSNLKLVTTEDSPVTEAKVEETKPVTKTKAATKRVTKPKQVAVQVLENDSDNAKPKARAQKAKATTKASDVKTEKAVTKRVPRKTTVKATKE